MAGWALDRVSGPGGTAPARAAHFKTAAVLILAAGLACADAWSFREVFVEAHVKTLVYPLLREHSPYLGFLR